MITITMIMMKAPFEKQGLRRNQTVEHLEAFLSGRGQMKGAVSAGEIPNQLQQVRHRLV